MDVRDPHEWAICHIEGARLIPLGSLGERLHELDTAKSYVLHCKSGARSAKAIGQLRKAGFRKLLNLRGGILAWAKEEKAGRCLDACLATLAVIASQALHVTGRQAPPPLRDFLAEVRSIVPPVEKDRVLGLELLGLAELFTKKVFTP